MYCYAYFCATVPTLLPRHYALAVVRLFETLGS